MLFIFGESLDCFRHCWVSQNQGQTILSLIYPHQASLYVGLTIGVPGVAFMLLAGNLHLYPRIFSSVWKHGKWILIAVFSADLLLQFKQLNLMHWRFELVSASLLTLTIWLQIYLFKSRRMQFLFETNINRIEKNE